MEKHLKGIANHHRIGILLLVAKNKKLTLEDIAERLDANEKTIGEHTRRLVVAGLINKHYRGRNVLHSLSPYGKVCVRFLEYFQRLS